MNYIIDNRPTVYANTRGVIVDNACCKEEPKHSTKDISTSILDIAVDNHRNLNDILNFIDSSFINYSEPENCETFCLSDCLEKTHRELVNMGEAIITIKNMLGI